jgi:hypothetical protein
MHVGWCCIQPSQQWFMLHSYLERSRILDLILEVASFTLVSDAVRVCVLGWNLVCKHRCS